MLCEAEIIDCRLSCRLKTMIGFRNIEVLDCRKLNLELVKIFDKIVWIFSRALRYYGLSGTANPTDGR